MSEAAAFDQMAEDVRDRLFEDSTFIPEIGDQVSIKVFYDQRISDQPVGIVGTALAYEQEIEFYFADLGRLPEPGEQFKIGDEYYVVVKVLDHDNQGRFCKVMVSNGQP
jgi:hypothetical protein